MTARGAEAERLLGVMNRVCAWQVSMTYGQLTCAIDKGHAPLFPVVDGGNIALQCPDCSYKTSVIPDHLLMEQ